jgi:hypothetical protein
LCTPLRLTESGTFVPFDRLIARSDTNVHVHNSAYSEPNDFRRSKDQPMTHGQSFDVTLSDTTTHLQPHRPPTNSIANDLAALYPAKYFSSDRLPASSSNNFQNAYLASLNQFSNMQAQQLLLPSNSNVRHANSAIYTGDYEEYETGDPHSILDSAADRIFNELQYMQGKGSVVNGQTNENFGTALHSECPCYLPLAGSISQLQQQLQTQFSPINQPPDLFKTVPTRSLLPCSPQRTVMCSTPAGIHNHYAGPTIVNESIALNHNQPKDGLRGEPAISNVSQACASCGRLPNRNVPPLPSEPWFFVHIPSRAAAEHVLCMPGNKIGAFLVRRTQQTGWAEARAPFVLSLLVSDIFKASKTKANAKTALRNAQSCGANGLNNQALHGNSNGSPNLVKLVSDQQNALRNRFSLPICLERIQFGVSKSQTDVSHSFESSGSNQLVAGSSSQLGFPRVLHYKIFRQRLCETCDCSQFYIDRRNRFDSIRMLVRFYSDNCNGLPVRLDRPCLPFDENRLCNQPLLASHTDYGCAAAAAQSRTNSPSKSSSSGGETQSQSVHFQSKSIIGESSKQMRFMLPRSSVSESALNSAPQDPDKSMSVSIECVICDELRRTSRENRLSVGSLCALPESNALTGQSEPNQLNDAVKAKRSGLCADHNGWIKETNCHQSNCAARANYNHKFNNRHASNRARLTSSADPLLLPTATKSHLLALN